jgi:hypothetical protein
MKMKPFFVSIHWLLLVKIIFIMLACSKAESNKEIQAKFDDRFPIDSSFQFPGYVVKDLRLREISGMAMSRNLSEAIWMHNDSGDEARIFLIDTKGVLIAQYNLIGINLRDAEDMAVGPGPLAHLSYIYLGDIGDNSGVNDVKYIYRFAEPNYLIPKKKGYAIANIDVIKFRYPDGRRDAEALMIDPLTKDLIVVSKREKRVHVYKAPYPQSTKEVILLEKIANLPVGDITAGDISANGQEILLKNYDNIYYWQRNQGESLEKTFSRNPVRLPYLYEQQGEAIAWRTDGKGYYTFSEKANQSHSNLFFYPRVEKIKDF